jgi:tetratricopeptide (TPR) repeat protein
MTGAKKIIKKKLKKPDEFINITEKAFLFITHHSKPIAAGGGILLILIVSIFFFQKWERGKEEKAYQMFNSAMETYQMVNASYREESFQEYKNVLEKFIEILTEFPRTSYGKIAILYKGNIDLRLGKFEEAMEAYESFLQKAGKEKLYRSFAMEGLGYAHEGKKDYEKAINVYQKVVDLGERFQSANAYLGLGRCYEKLGRNREALEQYKNFIKASQKSEMTNIVLRKISSLEK